MSKAEQVFNKIALNISDFEENYLGGAMLTDNGESKAKKLYAQKKSKSFILKHPWITGIPTLGIAPSIAGAEAKSSVARKLMQGDKDLRKRVEKFRRARISAPRVEIYNENVKAANVFNKVGVHLLSNNKKK